MYYRPKQAVAADIIPFYDEGEFKLFYLKDYRNFEECGEGCPWHLVTTKDFVNYEEQGEVLPRGKSDEQDLYVFTGCAIKVKSEYYIFYTGHNPHLIAQGKPQEKILFAQSHDLKHWEKVKNFAITPPDWLELHDFRDPFVYVDEVDGSYKMLLAARKKEGPVHKRGCTIVATSTDLLNWQVEKKPFYEPDSFFTHECPDTFKMGDWYYLIFSEFSDKVYTRYRMSKNQNGPWIAPKNDSFDGHCFYAAKSCADDAGNRYLFGWNCIRDREEDYMPWQWGGTIIAHQILQNSDGTLWVKSPQSVLDAYNKNIVLSKADCLGGSSVNGSEIRLSGEGWNHALFQDISNDFKLVTNFRIDGDVKDFGVILRADDNLDRCYFVKLEPNFNRLCFDRMPRKFGDQHFMVESERNISLSADSKFHELTVIVEGSVVEVYVDGKVAMGERMFEFTNGRVGLYSSFGAVTFKDTKVYYRN